MGLSTLPVIHRQVQCVVKNILALILLDMMSHRAYRRMAHIIITKGLGKKVFNTEGSLVLITTSVYLITPGLGKKVSTTRGSLVLSTTGMYLITPGMGKKVSTTRGSLVLYTPSMRVPTSSRGRVT